jgi:hypothetical protein
MKMRQKNSAENVKKIPQKTAASFPKKKFSMVDESDHSWCTGERAYLFMRS